MTSGRAEGWRGPWGKRADWCDYYGPVEGKIAGVAHLRLPVRTRGMRPGGTCDAYGKGLFAANPTARRQFEKLPDKAKPGISKSPLARAHTFHYRFYFHAGDTEQARKSPSIITSTPRNSLRQQRRRAAADFLKIPAESLMDIRCVPKCLAVRLSPFRDVNLGDSLRPRNPQKRDPSPISYPPRSMKLNRRHFLSRSYRAQPAPPFPLPVCPRRLRGRQ